MAGFYGERWDQIDLAEWLDLVLSDKDDGVTFMFPNHGVRDSFLAAVSTMEDGDVRKVLRRFLVRTGEYGADELHAEWLKHLFMDESEEFGRAMAYEYNRRLVGLDDEPTWQGITWILDLLPDWPESAIAVIDSFLTANISFLPDGKIWALGHAQLVIRARWIGSASTHSEKLTQIYGLGHRSFEHLVDELYIRMGYRCVLTRPSRDGGRDVLADRSEPGSKETARIECKLWRGRVGVRVVRALLGIVSDEKATKGVLICPGGFTRSADALAARNPRLELIGPLELLTLLDRHLGNHWPEILDLHINQSRMRGQGINTEAKEGRN